MTRPQRPGVEGLSERVLRALEASGCRRALAAVGPAVRREASWNGVTTAANQEWVVGRERFDAALLEDAAAAGVEVVAARITRIERTGDGWQAQTSDGQRWAGGCLVEARGRRAPGRRMRGPAATALGRLFEGVPTQPGTAVAGCRGGWALYASTGHGAAALQIVLSSAQPLPKRPGLPALFEALLEEVGPARDWLGGGRAVGEISARHADTSRADASIEDGLIRVGDAALALDPLSGHGVFEAIASATAAAPVINTVLRRPDDAALAQAFYEERVRLSFERFARIGRDFYRLEGRWREAPFWHARRNWPDDRPAHPPPSASVPQIRTMPVVEDGFVVAREVIVTADHPRGVFQVDGVPVAKLLRTVQAGEADPIEAARCCCDRAAPQVETALAWLRYRGLLRS